jgi:kumamolisin
MNNEKKAAGFERIEDSYRVVLHGAQAIGHTNPHSIVEVSLKLRRKKPLPELKGRPEQMMTREELNENYGASQQDIDKVVETFSKFGLKLISSNPATRTVKFSGIVSEMEKAFQVTLFNYSHPEGAYRGRVGYVHVPSEVKAIVMGVFGLDNRRIARRKKPPVLINQAKATATVPATWYKPSELAAHYNYPSGDGSGQAVGLLEFGGGYFPADLQYFCQLAGVEVPTIVPISTDGTSTSAKDGAEGEVMLDIEVVAGVCPKATIAVYFAEWSEHGWITALDAAVQDNKNNPGVISASWGAPEDTDIWTKQAITQFNETLMDAAHLNITVCIAAGDDGSSDADTRDGLAHVDFPGSSPYVLSVGGTTIPKKGGSQPDIVWFEGDGLRAKNGGSTGGGVSTVFPRPDWQSSIQINSVNPHSISGRCIPDLSANADWNASPYLLVVDGGTQPNGGTSAATPLLAALIALINGNLPSGKRVGYLTPILYQKNGSGTTTVGATGCTDVVSGNNTTAKAGGYAADPGYDAASGWGTPNGKQLLSILESQ